jgi:hypothetical protein
MRHRFRIRARILASITILASIALASEAGLRWSGH